VFTKSCGLAGGLLTITIWPGRPCAASIWQCRDVIKAQTAALRSEKTHT